MNIISPKEKANQIISEFESIGMDRLMAIKSTHIMLQHLQGAVPSEPCDPKSETPLIDVFKFWFGIQTEINKQRKLIEK